jgi:hypothetical protein
MKSFQHHVLVDRKDEAKPTRSLLMICFSGRHLYTSIREFLLETSLRLPSVTLQAFGEVNPEEEPGVS